MISARRPNLWELGVDVGIGAFLVGTALIKAAAIFAFIPVVLFLLPDVVRNESIARLVAIGIVGWEGLLGCMLVLGWNRRLVSAAVLVTLTAFSVALVMLLLREGSPGCGCLGLAVASQHAGTDAWLGLVRNGAIGALLVLSFSDDRAAEPGSAAARMPGNARGFTLIEVLVSLLVIAILVALALPALGAARVRGKETRSIAMQRSLVASLSAYGSDYKDMFPFLGVPADPFGLVSIRGFTLTPSNGYFRDHAWHWASVVVPEYCDAPRAALETAETRRVLDQYNYPDFVIESRFYLSYNVFAGPRYWEVDGAGDRMDLRATNHLEVLFPSQKGLLLDTAMGAMAGQRGHGADVYCAGVADGSARTFNASQVDPTRITVPMFVPGGAPVLSTKYGLSGIDF